MLVTFSCESYGKLTFFGDIARRLIQLMGHSDTIPGAIKSEDAKQALDQLVTGLSQIKNKIKSMQIDPEEEPEIGLSTRAIPLIDMLKSAIENKSNIIWQ